MKRKNQRSVIYAILAATLYALSSPCAKLLLRVVPVTMMAAFLYLGAGIGMGVIGIMYHISGKQRGEDKLTVKETPYIIAMIVLDILAPILLMAGLARTTAANASLLNNFEIVATSLIAFIIFKEVISKRLWIAIFLVTASCMLLSFEDIGSFSFSYGSLFVLVACICWGFENNCTRKLSKKDPLQIVVIKGLCSGTGSLLIAVIIGESIPKVGFIFLILLLGFFAYGLSIYFYVMGQRYLGAAKTSTFYAVAPFLGAVMSLVIFREMPGVTFLIAVVIMMIGAYYAATDRMQKEISKT
ncbi:MAG: DMT family transporter [Mobilitalea sp.]